MAKPAAKTVAPARTVVSDDEQAARAAGGSVGVEKLHRAAVAARKALAHESTPLMQAPDEVVANALWLAARK